MLRVRNSLKSILREERIWNMRVLDIMGSISSNEHLEVLRTITAKDNVHLTPASHKAFSQGLVKEASSFLEWKSKRKHSGKVSLCDAEWHGLTLAKARHVSKSPKSLTMEKCLCFLYKLVCLLILRKYAA
jgi:hypothetical protein